MFSAKLLRDEEEMRYYKNINATMLCESLKSTWHGVIADKFALIRENENMNDRTIYIEYVNADENICYEVVNKIMADIEPVVRNYLEFPKKEPVTANYDSENLDSLESEVASLELELRREKIYTALLNQRYDDLKIAKKLEKKISTVYVEVTEKLLQKTAALNELINLKEVAKSGEDVSERLLSLEKIVQSFESMSVIQEENKIK